MINYIITIGYQIKPIVSLILYKNTYTSIVRMIPIVIGEMLNMNLKLVGNQIKKQRELKKLTQEELAEKVGLSRNYISFLERGTKAPRLETLINIANALGVSANTLLIDVLDYDDKLQSIHVSKEIECLSSKDKEIIYGVINVLKNANSKFSGDGKI